MPEDIIKYSGNTRVVYHIMTEDETIQEMARLREKALHDEAGAAIKKSRNEYYS